MEFKLRVGKVGFEPNEPQRAADFKSAVSTTAPQPHIYIKTPLYLHRLRGEKFFIEIVIKAYLIP